MADVLGSAAALSAAADRFLARVGHWPSARWLKPSRAGLGGSAATLGASGSTGPPSRADLVFGLVQELADVVADAEGRPREPVPRLANDLSLPDQVRVMVADLLAAQANDEVVRAASASIDATARAL